MRKHVRSWSRNRNDALWFPEQSPLPIASLACAPAEQRRAGLPSWPRALGETSMANPPSARVLKPYPIPEQTALPCLVINDPLLRFPRKKQASFQGKELISNDTALTVPAIHCERGFDHELPLWRMTLHS